MKAVIMFAGLMLAGIAAQAQGAPDARLTKVLTQMDAASAKFVSAQAQFSWDQLTAVVSEHDVQKGTIAFRRGKGGTMMVVHVMTEDGQPAPKDVLYKNGVLDLYQPSIKQETVVQSGGSRGQFESYATLGFGGSGKDLQAQWNVTYEGAETIGGTAVAKLALAPKKASANEMFSKVEIWIDPATATSLKQVFYTPGGDTRTALYSEIKTNATPENAFAIKVPGGTNIVRK